MDFEEKTLERQEIFSGHVIHVVKDKVSLPQGKGISSRELVLHHGGVCVLAVTPERKIVLVRQYRKPIEKVSIEIPAGKLEPGEVADRKAAAIRELEEETHYQGELTEIYGFHTAVGFSNEYLTLYLADKIKPIANPRPQDEDETLELLEVSLSEALAMVASGDITDAKTIIALQYAQLHLKL